MNECWLYKWSWPPAQFLPQWVSPCREKGVQRCNQHLFLGITASRLASLISLDCLVLNMLRYENLPNNTLNMIGTPQIWMQISLLHSGTRRQVRDSINAVFKLRKEEKNTQTNTTLSLLPQQWRHIGSNWIMINLVRSQRIRRVTTKWYKTQGSYWFQLIPIALPLLSQQCS